MSEVQSGSSGAGTRLVRREHLAGRRPAGNDCSSTDRTLRESAPYSPKRDIAGVLVGAAEICLIARDPHLAVRAAWVLLRSKGMISDADALAGQPAPR